MTTTTTAVNRNNVTTTSSTDVKSFWTSKTFWSGVIAIITGISMIAQSGISNTAILTILSGIGAIVGRVQATGPIGLSTYTETNISTAPNGDGNGTNPPFDPLHSTK